MNWGSRRRRTAAFSVLLNLKYPFSLSAEEIDVIGTAEASRVGNETTLYRVRRDEALGVSLHFIDLVGVQECEAVEGMGNLRLNDVLNLYYTEQWYPRLPGKFVGLVLSWYSKVTFFSKSD